MAHSDLTKKLSRPLGGTKNSICGLANEFGGDAGMTAGKEYRDA